MQRVQAASVSLSLTIGFTMMKKRHALLTIIALLLAVETSAQTASVDNSIRLGGIDLTLNMRQADVLKKLSDIYDVRHMEGADGNWLVARRGGPPYQIIGTLGFGNERLAFVSKAWEPENNQTADNVTTALHNAARGLVGDGRVCKV